MGGGVGIVSPSGPGLAGWIGCPGRIRGGIEDLEGSSGIPGQSGYQGWCLVA